MHIIAPFEAYDEVSRTAIERFKEASNKDQIWLWSVEVPHANFKDYEIQLIRPYSGQFPQSGNLIVVGSSTKIGHWFEITRFDQITLIHLHEEQQQFYKTMHQLTAAGLKDINIEYGSSAIQRLIGLQGITLESRNI